MDYATLTEEIHTLSYAGKLELKTLIEKYLIEDRRKELLAEGNVAKKMADRGELTFSDDTEALISELL